MLYLELYPITGIAFNHKIELHFLFSTITDFVTKLVTVMKNWEATNIIAV